VGGEKSTVVGGSVRGKIFNYSNSTTSLACVSQTVLLSITDDGYGICTLIIQLSVFFHSLLCLRADRIALKASSRGLVGE